MRILHTSDWHLGISTGPASRGEEQRSFLNWLLELLEVQQVDVLIVAGDVFDTMHPSAAAQALYFEFLSGLADAGVRDVVIVGGNHDSPARLDAPRDLLSTVGIHVVGGLPSAGLADPRLIIPLRVRGSQEPAAVCLAVPYIHEYRLGIRTTTLDQGDTRAAFATQFTAVYSQLADRAAAEYPGLPIVATGHLTMGADWGAHDAPQQIHQAALIEGLPTSILDPRIDYTALGHIHRSHRIKGSSAWYSGTPIPYAMPEMDEPRQVLRVDLRPDESPAVEPIAVPCDRELVRLIGPPEAVLSELAALDWSTPLPPLVRIRVETQMAEPGLVKRLHDAIPDRGERGRPVVVDVQQRTVVTEEQAASPKTNAQTLAMMKPTEVFELMCDAKGFHDVERTELRAAFDTVLSTSGDVFEQLLADIDATPEQDSK